MSHLLPDCPHLHAEWLPALPRPHQPPHLRHAYSSDLAEIRRLKAQPARMLELYAAREAYNFPFCPRLYKYTIQQNEQQGSQLTFDLQLLLQLVPQRLTPTPLPPHHRRLLASKLPDLLRGFQYLFQRIGPFLPTPAMVGWTQLGVVKVWSHEDFSNNSKAYPANSEQEMVSKLLAVLRNAGLQPPEGSSFEQLLQGERRLSETPPKQDRTSEEGLVLRGIENKERTSKKNITFSYSNKDILENSQSKSHHKRSSIRVDQNTKPLSSFQLLFPPRPPLDKKVSAFRPEEPQQFKLKTLSQHFSKTTMGSLAQSAGSRAQLHYSTSSNPYAKLHHRQSNKAFSTFGLQEKEEDFGRKSDDIEVEAVTNRQSVAESREWEREITLGQEREEEGREGEEGEGEGRAGREGLVGPEVVRSSMRGSQEVREDLQALFRSELEPVDYSQLANELDCVLFS